MRDYTTNNYCEFLWVNNLLKIKRDANNGFTLEIVKGQKSSTITIVNVIVFGTIVEVKQVGSRDFLYQIDDGTGVIACKHNERQFEEVIGVIENEQVDILHQLSETQQNLDESSVADYSADDTVFNDRSLQIDEIIINKKSNLQGLLSIWDDIYKSFNCLIEQFNVGDFVVVRGKLYTYCNMNQIYINNIRAVDLMEEIMLVSIKLEDNFEETKGSEITKVQSDSEKRLSGLMTFDNIPHLNVKISIPRNIETPNKINNDVMKITPEIVTPNLEPSITFDTFTKKGIF